MEAIWSDLSGDDAQLESPDWHEKALKETQSRLSQGEEKSMDWEDAKKVLRKRFE